MQGISYDDFDLMRLTVNDIYFAVISLKDLEEVEMGYGTRYREYIKIVESLKASEEAYIDCFYRPCVVIKYINKYFTVPSLGFNGDIDTSMWDITDLVPVTDIYEANEVRLDYIDGGVRFCASKEPFDLYCVEQDEKRKTDTNVRHDYSKKISLEKELRD